MTDTTPISHGNLGYEKNSAESIYNYALLLTDKSLSEAVKLPENLENLKDRGKLGTLVEKYYFKHEPPNDHNPDFPEAGVELKVTGVVKHKSGKFVAKERLVLTMINYDHIVNESWKSNTFYNKCKKMLIMFYLYSRDIPVVDRKFVLNPLMYEIPGADLPIIQSDWEKIQKKVLEGKAHELSEGDTFYLGACRKGAGGVKEKLRSQPFSTVGAPSRAFSFKQGYLSRLIVDSQEDSSLGVTAKISIEEATHLRFAPYLGMGIEDLSAELKHHKRDKNHKNFHREIATKILTGGGSSVSELVKAGIEMKTVRLKNDGKPRESMSFPAFNFLEIGSEIWEESSFFEKIERKFLFIVFKLGDDGVERLEKAGYWNMPYEDRLEAERVWRDTQKRVAIDAHDLPGITESHVAHVRPKAKDGNDKGLTPQGDMRTKQCFWLNASYIAGVVSTI
jgi:DNA mismatch repair protein MutH